MPSIPRRGMLRFVRHIPLPCILTMTNQTEKNYEVAA
jgi:hypothetical protein